MKGLTTFVHIVPHLHIRGACDSRRPNHWADAAGSAYDISYEAVGAMVRRASANSVASRTGDYAANKPHDATIRMRNIGKLVECDNVHCLS